MTRAIGAALGLLVIAALVAGCRALMPAEAIDRREALVAAVREATPRQELDLTASLGSGWDRVVFLGPYSYTDETRDLLDLDFDVEAVSPWTYTEGGMIVVLAEGSKPVAWMAIPSSEIGLHCLDGLSVAAAGPTLVVQEDPDGLRAVRVAGEPCPDYEDIVQPEGQLLVVEARGVAVHRR